MNENNDSFDSPSDAQIEEFLGAYVLDALSDEERALVEAHLEQQPLASDEVDHLSLAAGWLADVVEPVAPPSDLWTRIASQLEDAPAGDTGAADDGAADDGAADDDHEVVPPPIVVAPVAVAPVVDPEPSDELAHRRTAGRGWSPARIALSAAAAVIVAVLIAAGGFALGGRDDASTTDLASQAQTASEQPGALVADLAGESGASAKIVMASGGMAYFIGDGLPALGDDQTYQLWSVVDGNAISVGVLGSHPEATMVSVGSDPGLLAVTVEPAEGSVKATTDPLVTGELT